MMRISQANIVRSLLAALCIAALSVGCNPAPYPKRELGKVSGTITYKGQPLEMGQILFQPPSGIPAVGEIQSDGTYSLEAVLGTNTVQIISRDAPDQSPPEDRDGRPPEAPKSYIPEIYGGPRSPLTFDVESGENTADFDLKDAE